MKIETDKSEESIFDSLLTISLTIFYFCMIVKISEMYTKQCLSVCDERLVGTVE
jgi:hypothetical protein